MTQTEQRPALLGVDGEPLPATMWHVARRPRWIALLGLALVVAAIFAWLGHWQIERSVESVQVVNPETETSKVLSSVATPQTPFADSLGAQRVSVTGEFDPDDFAVIGDRVNGGETGYWLIGRFVDDANGASLPVGLGWSATREGAEAAEPSVAATSTVTVEGRYFPSESPTESDFESGAQTVVSVAALINEWPGFDGQVYGGYVVSDSAPASLSEIDSAPPESDVQFNWLNVFYAIEWVVFAGFAVFLWFRLVRDAFEREHEEAEEARAEADARGATQPTRAS
ncbi:SURF1 family protein [Frigoribacterium sp. PhB118]|uniref:SURF1 family protein n=1 Tax=Frigoribacterium sp. PhB118 TaxID=2485175 RepID=UPI000F47AEAB|nr:SURF1 family protein [Frigoribacterium sp. PhB118]ROS52155.1 cytochrome oxidase assembly protein ShyY1 [Frigoribacterium sp. PhB118]